MRSSLLCVVVLALHAVLPALAAAQPVNLASGKTARQSSTAFGGEAARAIDGKTDGAWGAGSVTSTALEAGWFEVDLGAATDIGRVVLYNRTDCCRERLVGAVVELAGEPCDRRTLLARAAPIPNGGATHTLTFAPSVRARYVCVRQTTAQHLSIAELQVFPPPPPAAPITGWLSPGQAGFPGGGREPGELVPGQRLAISMVRVPSSALDATARVEIQFGGQASFAIGPTVARAASTTTELPLSYTLFPGQRYGIRITTGARSIQVGASGSTIRTTDLGLLAVPHDAVELSPPGLPIENGTQTGVAGRAYLVRFSEPVHIAAIAWRVDGSPTMESARIWDEQGAVLARGAPLNQGTIVDGWLASPLAFTFEADRTYLIGFHDPGGRCLFERKSLVSPATGVVRAEPYTVSLGTATATVLGVRSTKVGEGDVAPTVPNAYAPLLQLVRSTGSCAEGTCRP